MLNIIVFYHGHYRSVPKDQLQIKAIYEVNRSSEVKFHGQKTGPFFHSTNPKNFVGILSRYCTFIIVKIIVQGLSPFAKTFESHKESPLQIERFLP